MRRTLLLSMLWLLAGCAGSRINAQWSDPQFAGQPPRGAKVLVACQAADPTLRRVCADRMAAKLSALGAVPVLAPDNGDVGEATAPTEVALLQTARSAGAVALLRTQISPEVVAVAPGPSIGIGIGGFGGSYRSGGGVGFGVSAPLGGRRPGRDRLCDHRVAHRRGQRPADVERSRQRPAVVRRRPAVVDAGHFVARRGASGRTVRGLSLHQPGRVLKRRGGRCASGRPMRSYSAMTCAPSSSSVAATSRLSSTAIAVVSEP